MKNILFIHQSAELYGSDKTLLLLLKNLNKQEFNPIVILPSEGPLKEELENLKIPVIVSPVLKIYRKMFTPKNILSFFKSIKSTFKTLDGLNAKYNFDIIYSNTLAVLLGMLYAKKRKIRHIWHVHEIIVHPKIATWIFPRILNKYADLIICNSEATKNNLINCLASLRKKTLVIHNGIEAGPGSLNTNLGKGSFGFNEDDIIITLVGRINRLKGHQLLLKSFISSFNKNKKIKILIVGSPVAGQEIYLEEIESTIGENKIGDRVSIIPFRKNLEAIWSVTDIAVVPSTEAESFGLVALEAMLAKKPVVGSNHGGLTEIILDAETGFLVEPNNEKQLSEAIQKLIQDPELRISLGNNGYKRALEEFSVEKYVSEFENIFRNS